jgi:hypothetical protein
MPLPLVELDFLSKMWWHDSSFSVVSPLRFGVISGGVYSLQKYA